MKFPWILVSRARIEDLVNRNDELRSALRGMAVVASETQTILERERFMSKQLEAVIKYYRELK